MFCVLIYYYDNIFSKIDYTTKLHVFIEIYMRKYVQENQLSLIFIHITVLIVFYNFRAISQVSQFFCESR